MSGDAEEGRTEASAAGVCVTLRPDAAQDCGRTGHSWPSNSVRTGGSTVQSGAKSADTLVAVRGPPNRAPPPLMGPQEKRGPEHRRTSSGQLSKALNKGLPAASVKGRSASVAPETPMRGEGRRSLAAAAPGQRGLRRSCSTPSRDVPLPSPSVNVRENLCCAPWYWKQERPSGITG